MPHAVDVEVIPVDAVLVRRLCPGQVGDVQRHPAGIPHPVVVQKHRPLTQGVVPRLPRTLGRIRQVGVVGQRLLGVAQALHRPVQGVGTQVAVRRPVAVHVPEDVLAARVVHKGTPLQNAVLQDIPRQTIRVGLGASGIEGHGFQHRRRALAGADHIRGNGRSVHVLSGVQLVDADRNSRLYRLDRNTAIRLHGVCMLSPHQYEISPQGIGQNAVRGGGTDIRALGGLQHGGHARKGDLHPQESRVGGIHVGDGLMGQQTASRGEGRVRRGGDAQGKGVRDRQPLPADRQISVDTRFAEVEGSLQHGQGHGNAEGASVVVGDRKGRDLLVRHGSIAHDGPLTVRHRRDDPLLNGHHGNDDLRAGGLCHAFAVDRGQRRRHGGHSL